MKESGTNVLCDHPIKPNGILHSMNRMIDDIDGSVIMKNHTVGDTMNMDQELRVASIVDSRFPGKDKDSRPKLGPRRPLLFSAKELSSSIIASESNRIICSVSIALLVVLSYIDYPLLGVNIVNSKSIIALRPLYMLLMTEFNVIIAYLVLERRRFVVSEEDTRVLKGGGVNWERAEWLLEEGLVVRQTVRTVFIDLSVYVVLVICILSLVTRI